MVTKIHSHDFTSEHHEILAQMRYESESLILPGSRWHTRYLGRGEEKAVFCVCDSQQRVFAVELINERQYLNGRFVTGQYFFNLRVPSLVGVRAQSASEFGLTFTGLVKVREFAHGYEWSRFQFDPYHQTPLDSVLTSFLQSIFRSQFRDYQKRYQDAHDRNILFEIRSIRERGIPMLIKTETGGLVFVKVGLQPIDLR